MPLTLDQYRRALAAPPGRLPSDIGELVIASFEFCIRNDGALMDRELGLVAPTTGGVSLASKFAIRMRNEAYRRIGSKLRLPGDSHTRNADAVCAEIKRAKRNRKAWLASKSPLSADLAIIFRFENVCEIPDTFQTVRKILFGQVIENTGEPLIFTKPAQISK